jgi:hypothetical protein
MKIKYLAAVVISLAGLGLTQRADAILEMTYNNGGTPPVSSANLFGTVIPGTQSGGQVDRDVLMTNQLVGMTAGQQGTFTVNGTTSLYSRSFNDFGTPPLAVAAGAVTGTGIQDGTTAVTVSLGTGFTYLVAAYDGPNGSVAVFNVAGLTGSVDLFRYAMRDGTTGNLIGSNVAAQGFFRMTGWTLLNPTGAVPDGGTTVMLLGAALGALGMARRFLKI